MKKKFRCEYRTVREGRNKHTLCHATRAAAIRSAKRQVLMTLRRVYIWDKKQGFPRRTTCGILPKGIRAKSRIQCPPDPSIFVKRKKR